MGFVLLHFNLILLLPAVKRQDCSLPEKTQQATMSKVADDLRFE